MKIHSPSLRRAAFTLIEIMIVVGIIGLLAIAIVPNITKNRERAQLRMIEQNLRKIDAAKNLWALENNKGSGETPSSEDLKPYDGWPKAIAGETYNVNPVGTPPTATLGGKLGTNSASSVISLPSE
ncbi:MAG: prepilin-type N-terminal cleavage/methylation domain-containing protein [Verrucomicrobiales bacterium]|nr:prepilin-type N-terminal cleavage/methylation domain-containing protein [Verrucomicrobiales bacterium]